MKKIIFGMVAAASMLFASCSQDDIQVGQLGEESTVTVTLTTPQISSRAYSDGKSATHLQYAIYDVTYENTVTRLDKYTVLTETIDISKNIQFKLVNGHTYRFVFWASNPNLDGPYMVTFGESSAQFDIDLENYDANILSNLEYLDAFYVCEDVKVTGDMQKTFELRRPFAQVNLGTDDYDDAAAVGYVPTLSKVVVSNVYTTLNLFDGTVSNGKKVSFKYNVIGKEETFPYVDEANSDHVYTYLNMIYMLVDKEQELVDLTYSWKETGKTATDRTIGSVPVQRNYRTNIFGSILTNDVDVNIVIVPEYYEPDYNIDFNKALVEFDEVAGKFICTKPALPKGVTEEQLEGKGAVAIIDGKPVVIENDYEKIAAAMLQTDEIYFAPNSEITTGSHLLVVPSTGLTVYGNGATISGGERDFRLHVKDAENEEINLTIYDLNDVKVWGGDATGCTFNVTLKNCTMVGSGITDGSHSLFMTRSDDDFNNTAHYVLENCYAKDIQVGVHFTYGGSLVANRCTFDNVGIPFNAAKKETGEALDISISNCTFNNCGIPEGTDAWNYSAPIRVVDNNGPHKTTTLKVDKCTFNGTKSLTPDKAGKCDILLVEYRTDKERTWYDVDYNITNCGDYTLVDTCETMRGE